MLQSKYKVTSVRAGELQGAVFLVAGVLLPLVGCFCDKYGHLSLIMIVASGFNLVANLWWIFLPDTCATSPNACVSSVVTPIVLMGLSYGFFAGTAWNALVYQVREN